MSWKDQRARRMVRLETGQERNHGEREQVPLPPHRRRRNVEPELVAEPAEAERAAPALAEVRPDGSRLRLRPRVREPRLEGAEEGPDGADDPIAGLVAGGLRSLRALLHPHGLAQRRHL